MREREKILIAISAYLFLLQTFSICVFCHWNIIAYCQGW